MTRSTASLFTVIVPAPEIFARASRFLGTTTVIASWTWEPWLVVSLATIAALYVAGLVRLWHNAGRNHGIRVWQAFAFILGWAALAIALDSKPDAPGAILLPARVDQHELLMAVAAPLVVLGRPFIALLWALPARARRSVAQAAQDSRASAMLCVATAPATATTLLAVAVGIWQIPSLHQAALRNDLIHALQYISFFATATLLWWALINGRDGRLGYGMVYGFITSVHSGALGALLTSAPHVWYPIYETTTRAWGLSPIEGPQRAGLIVWVPAAAIFVILGLALFASRLAEAVRRVALTEDGLMHRTEK